MSPTRLTIIGRFHSEALASLQSNPALSLVPLDSDSPAQTEALIVRSQTAISDAFLKKWPTLRVLVTATAGFDHIDLEACARAGIRCAHCPDSHSASAAEQTWALVLSCARRTREADSAVRAGDWSRVPLSGTELCGKTYGVIGLGRIGSRVARIAKAFGMRVVAFDPYKDDVHFAAIDADRVGLDELFHLSQVMSIHVPKTHETRHMIHSYRLGLMQGETILVNNSRGGVINEADLITHLRQNGRGRFGLDVFENEPLAKDSSLLDFPNLVVSPHIGALTEDAFRAVSFEAAQNLLKLLKNTAPTGPLPPPDEWYTAFRP